MKDSNQMTTTYACSAHVKKQSLANDILHMAVCYYSQMNGILLIWYVTYTSLGRLGNPWHDYATDRMARHTERTGAQLAGLPSKGPEGNWKLQRSKGRRLRERERPDSRPLLGPTAWGDDLSVYKHRLIASRSEPSVYLHWNVLFMKCPLDFMWS